MYVCIFIYHFLFNLICIYFVKYYFYYLIYMFYTVFLETFLGTSKCLNVITLDFEWLKQV